MTEPPAPPLPNSATLAQGAHDLISRRVFQPIRRTRNNEGRWVVRYYMPNKRELDTISTQIRLSRRESANIDPDSVRPLDARQIAALRHMFEQIESSSLIKFEQVNDPAAAQLHYLTVNYWGGGLGQVRDIESGRTQIIVANRLYTAAERRGKRLATILRFNEGDVGYGTLLHETLHGLGLHHPSNWDNYRNGRDGTVMHYRGQERGDDNYLGRYDIAALQTLYGTPEELCRRNYTIPGFDTPPIPYSQRSEPEHGLPNKVKPTTRTR